MHTTAITASTSYTPVTTARAVASPQAPAVQAPLELSTLELPTRESLAQDTASFAADVRKKFIGAGVQVPPNPILSSDFQGHVRVVNDHPDKDKIEQLFKDNPELQQRYAKISAMSGVFRASDHYTKFATEYERLKNNPTAQRALVEAEVARNKAPFYLTITENGADPFFGISSTIA